MSNTFIGGRGSSAPLFTSQPGPMGPREPLRNTPQKMEASDKELARLFAEVRKTAGRSRKLNKRHTALTRRVRSHHQPISFLKKDRFGKCTNLTTSRAPLSPFGIAGQPKRQKSVSRTLETCAIEMWFFNYSRTLQQSFIGRGGIVSIISQKVVRVRWERMEAYVDPATSMPF